jgi:hypothetical protein
MAKADLTAERLREILHYDKDTGSFTWAHDVRCGHRNEQLKYRKGSSAGYVNKQGYLMICIEQRSYRAHRLAWHHVTGEWPTSLLDHKNEQKADNKWDNLRLADKSLNSLNRRKPPANNTSGYKGVTFHAASGLWKASLVVQGKTHSLRYHKTPELAYAARVAAERRLLPELNHYPLAQNK